MTPVYYYQLITQKNFNKAAVLPTPVEEPSTADQKLKKRNEAIITGNIMQNYSLTNYSTKNSQTDKPRLQTFMTFTCESQVPKYL